MEDKDNLVLIHKECGEEMKRKFQKKFDKYSIEVGDFVKKDFKEGKVSEHMWVKVTSLNETGVIGMLDNEPVFIKKIRLGDLVEVKLNEIEDHSK